MFRIIKTTIFLGLLSFSICTGQTFEQEVDRLLLLVPVPQIFNGTVLVEKNGAIILRKDYGTVLPDTYLIGSVTKQFTAVAILQLRDTNQIDLNQPVSVYLPNASPYWAQVKIENLLNHTSGIPDYTRIIPDLRRAANNPDSIINTVGLRPLMFMPGTKFNYSNSNYYVLGRIIEKISGVNYFDYISQHIFNTLSMNDSGFGPVTQGFSFLMGNWFPVVADDKSFSYSAGSIYSTANDLMTWEDALFNGNQTILRNSSVKEMTTPSVADGMGAYYGYGWQISGDQSMYYHDGDIEGFESAVCVCPTANVKTILLSNHQGLPVVLGAQTITKLAFKF